MRRVLIILLCLVSSTSAITAQEGTSGALTILVRDTAGQRLAGVSMIIYQDTDMDGRIERGRYTTDSQGEVHINNLAWGTYIMQFSGMAPDGRPMQPAAEQNMGMLDDGQGTANGFGLYFAELQRIEMYVLGTLPGEAAAVPMFDMADSPDAPPEPYDPIIALVNQGPTPTPYTLQQALDAHTAPAESSQQTTSDKVVLYISGVIIWFISLLIAYGYWKTGTARRQDERS